uniref:Uncharacterized protein n=1 Tax=Cucumis melo TaxID=3656 RepID=A0A9I9E237_CUCME
MPSFLSHLRPEQERGSPREWTPPTQLKMLWNIERPKVRLDQRFSYDRLFKEREEDQDAVRIPLKIG